MFTTEVQKWEYAALQTACSCTNCHLNASNTFILFFLSLSVDTDIVNGAYMSEALNDVFIDNFKKDPTLTWQYFGSATGFFRLYPGA